MKSVLVTGGSGFFGRHFVRQALAHGVARICVFSRGEYAQHLLREELGRLEPSVLHRVRFFIGDVRDVDRLRTAMHGCDTIVHAAALKRVEVGEYDSAEMAKTNVDGAMNVIEAAMSGTHFLDRRRRVVMLSTDKACHPENAYGASKLLAEKLFLAANNSAGAGGPIYAVCRYGNVAGSTGSVIPTWRRALEHGLTVRMTDPGCTRYWMTIDQAVQLVTDTVHTMRGGELAIPDLPAYRLGDLAEAMGVTCEVTRLGAGEKLHESMQPGHTSEFARRMGVQELRGALLHV